VRDPAPVGRVRNRRRNVRYQPYQWNEANLARVAPLGPVFGVTPAQADSFYDDLMSGAFEGDNEEAYIPPSLTPSGNVRMSHDEM